MHRWRSNACSNQSSTVIWCLVHFNGDWDINHKVSVRDGNNVMIYDQTVLCIHYLDCSHQTLSRKIKRQNINVRSNHFSFSWLVKANDEQQRRICGICWIRDNKYLLRGNVANISWMIQHLLSKFSNRRRISRGCNWSSRDWKDKQTNTWI